MSHNDCRITAINNPSFEKIIEIDLAFHLGRRDNYDFDLEDAVRRNLDKIPNTFACFQIESGKIIASKQFSSECYIRESAIRSHIDSLDPKLRRVIDAFNRDRYTINDSVYYAYDLQDARHANYIDILQSKKSIPVIQYHRKTGYDAIIIPLPGYHDFPSRNIPDLKDKKRFSEKLPKIFWRGVLSGEVNGRGVHLLYDQQRSIDREKIDLFRKSIRFRICHDFIYSDIVDAKLVQRTYFADAQLAKAVDGIFSHPVSPDAQLNYKYLLCLDGYDGPSNLYWALSTNSIVFRHSSQWEMFGDCYFSPWVHYIPLLFDCSDIVEKFEWCESHPQECERIIANAKASWNILFNKDFQRKRQEVLMSVLSKWLASV